MAVVKCDCGMFVPSKVVNQVNVADMIEMVGVMRMVAEAYTDNGNVKNCSAYIKRLANRLEVIANMMLEEC